VVEKLKICPIPPYSLPLYLTLFYLIKHSIGEGVDWVLSDKGLWIDVNEKFILYSCNF
jgi:hypothetical protein